MLLKGHILLYTNSPGFTPGITLDQLTEATFPGYARLVVALSGPYTSEHGSISWVSLATLASFGMTDATVSQTIVGAAVVDANGEILAGGDFETPVRLIEATDRLIFDGRFQLDSDGMGGAWVVVNP